MDTLKKMPNSCSINMMMWYGETGTNVNHYIRSIKITNDGERSTMNSVIFMINSMIFFPSPSMDPRLTLRDQYSGQYLYDTCGKCKQITSTPDMHFGYCENCQKPIGVTRGDLDQKYSPSWFQYAETH